MIKLIIITMLISATAYAGFPSLQFEDLNGDFQDSKGVAFAQAAKYDIESVRISHSEIEVRFNKLEKHLVIKDEKTTVELKFDFSFLNIFRAFNFSGVDISSNQKRFAMFLETLNIYIDPSEYKFSNIRIETDISKISDIGQDIDILDGFMLNGQFQIEEARLGKLEEETFFNDLLAENPKQQNAIQEWAKKQWRIPLVARNLKIKVEKEQFLGSVKLDSWINLNLYLNGNINHDAKNKKLLIDLTRAKLGIFSIKSFILNSIKRLNVENIQVENNRIIINLDKAILTSGRRS